jgi:hypothetical protein
LLKTGTAQPLNPDLNNQSALIEQKYFQLAARLNELSLLTSKQHEQVLQQLDAAVAQQDEFRQTVEQTISLLSNKVEHLEGLDAAVAQQNEFRQTVEQTISLLSNKVEHLEGLDERVRLNMSYIRMMQQNSVQRTPNSLPVQMRGSGIVEVLRRLEDEAPELQHANQVDITIQSSGAEEEIAQLVARLKDRHCVVTPQLWYYIDFNPHWDDPTLFQSAQNKVKAGGRFVVITGLEQEVPPHNGDTSLDFESAHAFPDLNVTAYIWRNEPPASIMFTNTSET